MILCHDPIALNKSSNLENRVNVLKISIIVPCYNAESKIGRCLTSLDQLDFPADEFEVIFVDDASSDETPEILRRLCRTRRNWHLIVSKENSGSPSHPRNMGIEVARGDYIFFLDSDDEVISSSLTMQYELAVAGDLDLVRASLIVNESGRNRRTVNRIGGFERYLTRVEKVSAILRNQSTTNSSLVSRRIFTENGVRWPEHLHMGEDTVFLIDVMTNTEKIGYVDVPAIVYNRIVSNTRSATQSYGARELDSHLEVWKLVELRLASIGISYMDIRGHVAIKFVIESLHKFYAGDIDRDRFAELSDLINSHPAISENFDFSDRLRNTFDLICKTDYDAFVEDIKPRLLIAGTDLKFITAAIPSLSEYFQVRIDEWTGHDAHDEKASRKLLDWAEIIWCEWLLGNSVWYAANKRWNQKLVVRLHLFELTRDFGKRIDVEKVDCFFSVSVHTTEEMIRVFGFPRAKVRLIPNFLDTDSYAKSEDPDRVFNLGIVGILPRRKGYMKAIELLSSLVEVDRRYSLSVFGKAPKELAWVYRDPEEREYYEACQQLIVRSNLEDHVNFDGWVDTRIALADVGFILSLSDFESFHVAPAEAFVSGNQALFLPWDGVEYIYPREYIFDNVLEMRDKILSLRDVSDFNKASVVGRNHVLENYSLNSFVNSVRSMVVEI